MLLCALALTFFVARSAGAEGGGPIVVALLSGADVIDEVSLRDAASRELGVRALAPGDTDAGRATATLTVGIDRERGELLVTRRAASGTIVRRVALEGDRAAVERAAVLLIGNLARDEAADVLGVMHAGDAPPAPGPRVEPARPVTPRPPPVPAPATPREIWFGIAVEGQLVLAPGDPDACAPTANGLSPGGYVCTYAGGNYSAPPRAADSYAPSGHIASGLIPANTRFLLSADYTVSDNVLVGVRVGFSSATYPGNAIAAFGHLHLEGRATYLIGEHPLSEEGLSPAVMIGAGAAETSTSVSVVIPEPNGVARTVTAWRVAGPAFGTVGGGVRYAPSTSFAIVAYPAKLTLAMGAGDPLVAFSPEIGAQIGF